MNEAFFAEVSAWLTQAGLAGSAETDIVSGFCERCVAAGLPLHRVHVLIDTLHPVHEGSLFRWGYTAAESPLLEYGRTDAAVLAASGADAKDVEAAERWKTSPFYSMLQTGESLLRLRLTAEGEREFGVLPEMRAAGMTDYVAIINRFAAEGTIGDMDCVYSSWATSEPGGFSDGQIAALQRIVPFLALAIKSVSLARMTGTLMQTYLGRDAAQRVLSGRIVRGVADRIDAVIWFSDLRGFTRITDTAPEQVIPLLNDYADAIVSAIHEHGGDVLKLIGDGVLAIFTAEDRERACQAALSPRIPAPRHRGARRPLPAPGPIYFPPPLFGGGLLGLRRQRRAARPPPCFAPRSTERGPSGGVGSSGPPALSCCRFCSPGPSPNPPPLGRAPSPAARFPPPGGVSPGVPRPEGTPAA